MQEAARDFLGIVQGLRAAKELSQYPSDLYAIAFRLGRVIESTKQKIHPIRYLIVIDWLFDDAAHFVRSLSTTRGPELT